MKRELEVIEDTLQVVTEGRTKLSVLKKSITEKVPPKKPVFFNPKAKTNRDFSIIAYAAFLDKFEGPRIFLEGMTGVGARGLRVANELEVDKVVINDLNPSALKMAQDSAKLNGLENVEFSEKEVCRFLGSYSKKGKRGSMVDIDPFGSPAAYFDCGLRATMHGGMLSVAATDLQVLNGLFDEACKRKYGGVPIRVKYGDEIAIRLILGCLWSVAARLGVEMTPIFVESEMHYYRTYVIVRNRSDQQDNMGYVIHCKNCGNRKTVKETEQQCELCKSKTSVAGPLWIGKIFDGMFVKDMIAQNSKLETDKACEKTLYKCIAEADMPATYYTIDEVASLMRASPPKLENAILGLQDKGFSSSITAFEPTGFKTDANINDIIKVFESIR